MDWNPLLELINHHKLGTYLGGWQFLRSELLPGLYVYVYIFAMFFAGTMLSFGDQKSLFALLAAGFSASFSVISHSIMAPVDPWLKVRMVVRDAATVGMYIIIASRGVERLERRYRLAWMYQYGCALLTAFFCITAFQLNRSPQEQGALNFPYYIGEFTKIILAGTFMVCGLLLASDRKTKTVSSILVVSQLLYISLVEMRIHYWTKKLKVELSTQVDLIISSFYILIILLLIALK
ncbi:transmembrane protein 101-like isoform X2 [Apostichopus japonicus]|uniref:transmembrane protein 101-like isoform X2 n=1 Tax=Stichopus japonicus TaxID=307972 RepID=UPI003AB118DA